MEEEYEEEENEVLEEKQEYEWKVKGQKEEHVKLQMKGEWEEVQKAM